MTFFLQTQSGFYRLAFDWPDVRLALDAVSDQLRAGLLTAAEATAIGHAVGQALLRHTMSSPLLTPAALVYGATDEQVDGVPERGAAAVCGGGLRGPGRRGGGAGRGGAAGAGRGVRGAQAVVEDLELEQAMKTTKPKPGAAAKRKWRVLTGFGDVVTVKRYQHNIVWLSVQEPGHEVFINMSAATARRIAKALLAASDGGTKR